jgi:hypothetical protein
MLLWACIQEVLGSNIGLDSNSHTEIMHGFSSGYPISLRDIKSIAQAAP